MFPPRPAGLQHAHWPGVQSCPLLRLLTTLFSTWVGNLGGVLGLDSRAIIQTSQSSIGGRIISRRFSWGIAGMGFSYAVLRTHGHVARNHYHDTLSVVDMRHTCTYSLCVFAGSRRPAPVLPKVVVALCCITHARTYMKGNCTSIKKHIYFLFSECNPQPQSPMLVIVRSFPFSRAPGARRS
ncbi:hypothetical protein T440DRAFT_203202 [Plenodomus tracheiphilus IPT5]|uniref:Uncharacterized protein n=1 Tax=Plenodomus tracheiphilus IPT5 TaxID=1408161 RepID=A0A6A7BI03_9PLEO|nr:hypothetical protein T440DRAFT_203202 [Plenodomus tracheiphilus IPT5]